MTAALHALIPSSFDSRMLGLEWYRLNGHDPAQLERDLSILSGRRFGLDARIQQDGAEGMLDVLRAHGGCVICEQSLFDAHLPQAVQRHPDVALSPRLEISPDAQDRHSANFPYSRFRRDPLLAEGAAARLYAAWWRNSLEGGALVAQCGERALCTFTLKAGIISIDLLSVLDKRQGQGRRLLETVMACGREMGATRIQVRTEIDNPARFLYMAQGFREIRRWHVAHLIKGGDYD